MAEKKIKPIEPEPAVGVVATTGTTLGVKMSCPACSAKFYDMNRSPVTCPKCKHAFEEENDSETADEPATPAPRGRRGAPDAALVAAGHMMDEDALDLGPEDNLENETQEEIEKDLDSDGDNSEK